MSDKRDNHRRYYRLAYPSTMMPSMHIAGREYVVVEISEGGLRIRCEDRFEFGTGDEVRGEIVFQDDDAISISGVVLRCERHDLIIAPLEGISFKRVVFEQRRILSQCPSVRTN